MKHTAKNKTCPFPSAQAFPSPLFIMFFLFLCLFCMIFFAFMFFGPLENRLWKASVSTEGLPNLTDFSWNISPVAYDRLKIHSLLTGFLCTYLEAPAPPSSDVSPQPNTKTTFPCWIMILLMGLLNNYLAPSHFWPSFCFCWSCIVLVGYVEHCTYNHACIVFKGNKEEKV